MTDYPKSFDATVWTKDFLAEFFKPEHAANLHGLTRRWFGAALTRGFDEAAAMADYTAWAVERWHAQVGSMPLHWIHREVLDTTYREIIRKYGGDDIVLCGPTHAQLVARERTST